MTQYAMTTRTGSVVIKAHADNLEEAIEYFSKMNNSEDDDDEYFPEAQSIPPHY